ncbi:Cupredoxin [Mollisia scopiformis]|uniref:Cupredoxin n=1 Tax=Mollisia scopiformis TaxID=149040 RepID=A0A194XHE6_MOLSC|nr:Cupredoxin [Mollisia scopiformis]KUJ19549.1 Cupredoxin [Mollisia scopiformis]
MRFSTASVIGAAATASAQTIQVSVGENGLTFTPNDITATVGQSVEFSFFPKNHSVTQSSFAEPCHPLAGGFFSTFMPTTAESSTTFTIVVNDTKPIWIYCGQTTGNHCQSGMVAAINAPTTGNTLTAFAALAKNATASTSPPGGVAGGILKVGSASSNSSSSASGEKTVTASVTTTVTALVTSGGSSYTTTYGTTYGTTYTTPVAAGATGSGSSTSSAAKSTGTNAASPLAVNGGIVGAALVFALGML